MPPGLCPPRHNHADSARFKVDGYHPLPAPHTKNQLKMFCEQLMKNCSTALFKSTYANFCSNLVIKVISITSLRLLGAGPNTISLCRNEQQGGAT